MPMKYFIRLYANINSSTTSTLLERLPLFVKSSPNFFSLQIHQLVLQASHSTLFTVFHKFIPIFTLSSSMPPQAFPQFKAFTVSCNLLR